jgi:hypothetical protein
MTEFMQWLDTRPLGHPVSLETARAMEAAWQASREQLRASQQARPRSCPSCHGILVASATSCPDPWHDPLPPSIQEEGTGLQPSDFTRERPIELSSPEVAEIGPGVREAFDEAIAEHPQPPDHHHLTYYGHRMCYDPACAEPRDDPANDMHCPDPGNCEGDCEAVRHNAERRRGL